MAYFSPVNGAYPHKDQIDRSCYVSAGNAANIGIERGTIVYVDENGEFTLATNGEKKPMYIALQPYGDMQAAMAGSLGTGGGTGTGDDLHATLYKGLPGTRPATPASPKITGLSFQEHGNYATDVYDHEAPYKIGDPLTVAAGKFTTEGATEENAVGHVYAAPDDYYFNGAEPTDHRKGWSTGGWIKVLKVSL